MRSTTSRVLVLSLVPAALLIPTGARAGGGFTVVTEESGVAALRASKPADWWVSGLHLIDLDADDDLDLFMSAHGGGFDVWGYSITK